MPMQRIAPGFRVRRTLFMTYIILRPPSGIGGFVYLCYIGSASSTTGTDTNVNLIFHCRHPDRRDQPPW